MDKFLLPSTVAQAGQTGGSLNLSIPGVTVNGTVGGDGAYGRADARAHAHRQFIDCGRAYAHSRHDGDYRRDPRGRSQDPLCRGGLYQNGNYSNCDNRDSENGSPRASFAASRTWSGETSSGGSHSHTMNLNSTGGGQGHTHTITSSSEAQTLTLDRPPFYRLAYFVKLPE